MLIWSGWGILVPIVVVVSFFGGTAVSTLFGLDSDMAVALSVGVTGVIAGVVLFFVARAIEGRPGRVFIDEATNQRIEMRPSAGSFFFVPTRYWAFITPVLLVAFGAYMAMDPATSRSGQVSETTSAAAPATPTTAG